MAVCRRFVREQQHTQRARDSRMGLLPYAERLYIVCYSEIAHEQHILSATMARVHTCAAQRLTGKHGKRLSPRRTLNAPQSAHTSLVRLGTPPHMCCIIRRRVLALFVADICEHLYIKYLSSSSIASSSSSYSMIVIVFTSSSLSA